MVHKEENLYTAQRTCCLCLLAALVIILVFVVLVLGAWPETTWSLFWSAFGAIGTWFVGLMAFWIACFQYVQNKNRLKEIDNVNENKINYSLKKINIYAFNILSDIEYFFEIGYNTRFIKKLKKDLNDLSVEMDYLKSLDISVYSELDSKMIINDNKIKKAIKFLSGIRITRLNAVSVQVELNSLFDYVSSIYVNSGGVTIFGVGFNKIYLKKMTALKRSIIEEKIKKVKGFFDSDIGSVV
ncbi:hypothetical protein ACHFCA_53120 (plasmid) [Delftia tsuruhatensis]